MGNRNEKSVQELKDVVWDEIEGAKEDDLPIRQIKMEAIHNAIRYIQGIDSKDEIEEKLQIDLG